LADPSMKCSFMAIFGPQSRPAMSKYWIIKWD
jgi:hypothetical protein